MNHTHCAHNSCCNICEVRSWHPNTTYACFNTRCADNATHFIQSLLINNNSTRYVNIQLCLDIGTSQPLPSNIELQASRFALATSLLTLVCASLDFAALHYRTSEALTRSRVWTTRFLLGFLAHGHHVCGTAACNVRRISGGCGHGYLLPTTWND